MDLKVYTIWDRVAQTSSQLMLAKNEKEIFRILRNSVSNTSINDEMKTELVIIEVGDFNNETLALFGHGSKYKEICTMYDVLPIEIKEDKPWPEVSNSDQ